MLSKNYFPIVSMEIITALLIAFAVATRNVNIGADTLRYIDHFKNIGVNGFNTKHEVGFTLIAIVAHIFHSSYEFFFFLIAFIITLCMFRVFNISVMYRSFTPSSKMLYSLFFLASLFFSSWFYVAVANGLRQGLALPFLYLSLYEGFYNKRPIKSFVFFTISCSFHISSLLVLVILPLFFLNNTLLYSIWASLSLTYLTGLNEYIFKFLSDFSGLGVYEFFKNYSVSNEVGGVVKYAGFDPRFFFYTLFWPIFYYILLRFRRGEFSDVSCKKDFLVRMYTALSCLFFILGFAPFSNRYAFICWLLVPVLQVLILEILNIRSNFMGFFIAISFVFVGLIYFIFVMHPL